MAYITYSDGTRVEATRTSSGTYVPKTSTTQSSGGTPSSSRGNAEAQAIASRVQRETYSSDRKTYRGTTTPTARNLPVQSATDQSTTTNLRDKVEAGTANEQERAMFESANAYDRYGNTAQPYYRDATGRKWTESQLYFVDQGEATALRYAAATGSPRPKITTYKPEMREQVITDVATGIMLPYTGSKGPVKSSRELKNLRTASNASGVLSRSDAKAANQLTEQINQEYATFNKKWSGAGELTESQVYAYTMERQELVNRTAPLQTQRNILISSSDVWAAKSEDYTKRANKGREELIPVLAKETARKMEKESIYGARVLATTPSTPEQVLETTARGVASGAGYGLLVGGIGFAPLTPVTVAGGAISGGLAGIGFEAGKTLTVAGFKMIPEGSELERKYLMTKPIPKFESASRGKVGIISKVGAWLEAAPNSPTLEQYVEAEMRGEDTYKDYELFNPQLAVQGTQIGVGLAGSVASIETGARIATMGTPKLMALRNNLIGKARLEGEFTYEKNTKLITGETQADVSLETAKGDPVGNPERFSVGRGERIKIYAESGDHGSIASKSDITTYKSGKTPEFGSQYDFTKYKVISKDGATTNIYTQGFSSGGGKDRISELGLRVTESTPGNYMVTAQGKIIPTSPLEPKIDVVGDFRFTGVTETQSLASVGDPVKMIPPSGGAKTPWDYGMEILKFKPGEAFKGSVGSLTKLPSGGSSGGGFTSLSPYTQSQVIEEVSLALINPPGTSFSNVPPNAVLPPGITATESIGAVVGLSYPITGRPKTPPGGNKIKRPEGKIEKSLRPELQTISSSLPVITGIKTPSEKSLTSRINVVSATSFAITPKTAPSQPTKPIQTTKPVTIPAQITKPITVTETITEPAPPELITPITPGVINPFIKLQVPAIIPIAPQIPLGIWKEGVRGVGGSTKRKPPRYAPSVSASVFNVFTTKKQPSTGWSGFETRPLVVKKTKAKSTKKKKKSKSKSKK